MSQPNQISSTAYLCPKQSQRSLKFVSTLLCVTLNLAVYVCWVGLGLCTQGELNSLNENMFLFTHGLTAVGLHHMAVIPYWSALLSQCHTNACLFSCRLPGLSTIRSFI